MSAPDSVVSPDMLLGEQLPAAPPQEHLFKSTAVDAAVGEGQQALHPAHCSACTRHWMALHTAVHQQACTVNQWQWQGPCWHCGGVCRRRILARCTTALEHQRRMECRKSRPVMHRGRALYDRCPRITLPPSPESAKLRAGPPRARRPRRSTACTPDPMLPGAGLPRLHAPARRAQRTAVV